MTDEQARLDDQNVVDVQSASPVDEVLAPLETLERAPLGEHAPIFEGIHAGLQRLLVEPDL
ncbi:hypothetical protein [Sanguibacter antarcticus]|uniref:Uncharacterized protein n=1 Tax=Sanguibacter antarcticus TaxID=372484 RepID=A0A2A9E390_9MICO|nr:hypothetical protein [Sanguibacter antarcticus]PFG33408.1 hypothetical protein ATL42_1281 [Sanguibacter antarcticus]